MQPERRLWTGDWERDSAARAEELAAARRRRQPWEPEPELEAEPEAERERQPATAVSRPQPAPTRPPAPRRPRTPVAARLAPLRRRLPARTLALVLIGLLLIAAVAVALTAVLSSGSSSDHHASSAAVREADRWLGVQLVAGPGGSAVLETVDPNGAAAYGGLEPGDVISQINGQAVDSLGAAANAIDGMQQGQQAVIVVDRGSAVALGSFPMPVRPGSP